MKAFDIVLAARDADKISTTDLITELCDSFVRLQGDQLQGADEGLIAGLAMLNDLPITVIGIQKGQETQEKIDCHFGSLLPSGYRTALRLMKQSAHFKRPILTLINTPGAYPGLEAERNGQGKALADCLAASLHLTVPYVALITGEGGSGGAIALACGDEVWMTEDSIYSILSPEGYASILWKDASRAAQAAEELQLTPAELLKRGVIEAIQPKLDSPEAIQAVKAALYQKFTELQALPVAELIQKREDRFRKF